MEIATAHRAHVAELYDRVLGQRQLILASNRGPVEYQYTPDGRQEVRRGSGGVVTALNSLTHVADFTWVAGAMSEGDRRAWEASAGQPLRSPLPGHRVNVRFVSTPRRVYHKYYNVFCNPLLWFLQHYMWNSPYNPNIDATVYDAWDDGYVPVNQAFAQAVADQIEATPEPPVVVLHDYHLYLAPAMVREKAPEAIIQHFSHIPWPAVRYWELLPAYMLEGICHGLCGADILGFQTPSDVRNFLDTCEWVLPDVQVDHARQSVLRHGHTTYVRCYPVSINVDEIRRMASGPRALDYERQLRKECGELTIMRVDRAEPSKNVVRGFRAYDLLLNRHPELKGRVVFLAFLVPSRTHIRQYQRYMEEIRQIIDQINTTHGTEDWTPIRTYLENNYTQAIAGMKLYDVLLVNSVIDGMNLVAKEGPVVNNRDGVLVLSVGAGAHRELSSGALSVSPADIEGTMQAMYQGLTMSPEERADRAHRLRTTVEERDNLNWLGSQLQDIETLLLQGSG